MTIRSSAKVCFETEIKTTYFFIGQFMSTMATSDPEDSVEVAMKLVQSLRQTLSLLERSHETETLLVSS
jgi:hypothetical protein